MLKRLPPIAIVAALIVAVVAGAVFLLPSTPVTPKGSRPTVAASTYPLYDIASSVAGDAVHVELILPPGSSPHAYEPRPSDVRKLADAKVAYVIGHGLDSWMDILTESSKTPQLVVDRGIALREPSEPHGDEEAEAGHEGETHEEEEVHFSDDGHDHSGEDFDPHYWLSIPNAQIMAQTIATDLSARFPEHAGTFAANLTAYLSQLAAADAEMRSIFAGVANKKIITMHDAWYYFAEAYGLEIAGSFEPSAGREPTPQYLVELQQTVEAANAKTLYTEPLIATTSIQSFIRDNDLGVAVLDPVEGAAGEEQHYAEIMVQNARTIRDNQ